MNWRLLLYHAFPNQFRPPSEAEGGGYRGTGSLSDLEDLHEYAVFLRSRFSVLSSKEQRENLPFVLENLIDTSIWDSRGVDAFLEWLNPFNDYQNSEVLDRATWIAERYLEGEKIPEMEITHLMRRLERLPVLQGGRLELFSSLSRLQRVAIAEALQYFEAQYGAYLGWIERLELSMALLYWRHAAAGWSQNEARRLLGKHWAEIAESSELSDSPWAPLRVWLEQRKAEDWVFFAWRGPEEVNYVSEFALTPSASSQQRTEFTRDLSTMSMEQLAALPSLYAWVYRGDSEADCFWTPWGANLLSPKVRNLLEQMGLSDTVRYIPVELRDAETNAKIGNYDLAVYQVRLVCLSRERTIGIWDPNFERVLDLHRPVLLWSRVIGHDLFVAAEDPRLIVVSKRLKQALEKAEVRGCVFEGLRVV
ncbi:MAG: hypothetical protein N2045_00085 [Fimbriimonadales bacterium]|nr:hypothetical protein [Fimbriimonadales bacterium]